MSAILLALMLAQEPTPKDTLLELPVMAMKKGQFAPHDGVLLSGDASISTAKRITGCEAQRDALIKSNVSVPIIVLLVVAGILVGGGAGYGVARLAK